MPIVVEDSTVDGYPLEEVLLVVLGEVRDVKDVGRWVEVLAFRLRANILLALLIFSNLPPQKRVVM